jgi:Mg2+/citrate symporter
MKPSEIRHPSHSNVDQSDKLESYKISKIKKNNLLISEGDSEHNRDEIQLESSDINNMRNIVIPQNVSTRMIYNYQMLSKICKEILNVPLVCGVVSIILTIIPYANTFFTNKDWVFYKTFAGQY